MLQQADGYTWRVRPYSDDRIAVDPHEQDLEPVLRGLLPAGGTFVDVGAHVGRWSVRLAGRAGRVIAVEPNPDTHPVLAENLRRNDVADKVAVLTVAAWSCDARLAAHNPSGHLGGASTEYRPGGDIPGEPLDRYLLDEDRVDLIKIDVEGAEPEAIQGMAATIRRHRPTLLVELWHDDHAQQKRVRDLLADLGYGCQYAMAYLTAHYFIAQPHEGGTPCPPDA